MPKIILRSKKCECGKTIRKVIVFERTKNIHGIWNTEPAGAGKFIQYGCNYDAYENEHGVGNFTTAIVEMDDGTVQNVPVELIKFVKDDNKKHIWE